MHHGFQLTEVLEDPLDRPSSMGKCTSQPTSASSMLGSHADRHTPASAQGGLER